MIKRRESKRTIKFQERITENIICFLVKYDTVVYINKKGVMEFF